MKTLPALKKAGAENPGGILESSGSAALACSSSITTAEGSKWGGFRAGASQWPRYLPSSTGWAAGWGSQGTRAPYLGCGGGRLQEPGLFPEAASHDASYFHRLLQVSAL